MAKQNKLPRYVWQKNVAYDISIYGNCNNMDAPDAMTTTMILHIAYYKDTRDQRWCPALSKLGPTQRSMAWTFAR
jgi:hypothetical protein